VRSISNPDELGEARFELSVARRQKLPPDRGYEVAFAGRSNAGKSTALNAVTGKKALARTSKTPGRTQLINFFRIDESRALVDLPGYGYARVAADIRATWDQLLAGYLKDRRALHGVILVMDSRHPLGDQDRVMLEFCLATRQPVHILLSKCDKLSHSQRLSVLQSVQDALAAEREQISVQLFSASSGQGIDEARERLRQWLELPPGKKNPGNKGKDSGAIK